MFGREGRVRLFLAFLIVVLVLVNSQSLMVTSRSRADLEAMFELSARNRAERIASELLHETAANELESMASTLARETGADGAACILDWSGVLVSGGGCAPSMDRAFDRLDRDGRRRLLEEGWAMTAVAPRYDVERASAAGYLVLARDEDRSEAPGVLRVEMEAAPIAEANRHFRTILLYQISALSLVLVAMVLFLHSLLAPHRRLVAEARVVASELDGEAPFRDEGEFLLETFQDVVARLKGKEEQLQALHRLEKARADENEALASDIIRSMTTGLVGLDPSGKIAVVNPAAEAIFGIGERDAIGRPFTEVLEGSTELTRLVGEALERGAYHLRDQVRYRRSGESVLHLGASVLPLKSDDGSLRGAICLVADLTEVVELRERLLLKENLARVGEMTAGIAHEFRNGLATILGNARLLKDGAEGDAAELAEAVLEEGHTLARVVTEFLQYARPDALHTDDVDLEEILRSLLVELRPRAEARNVELALEGGPARLEGDEALLRKAFSNLVVNAIEAVADARKEGGRVVVTLREAAGTVVVRVRDNGPGIVSDDRPRIFTPFFTRKETGTGLGLSVVQKIAVSHNGSVTLEDSGDSGTTFVVRLPTVSGETEPRDPWV